jgi:hypothetical protein
VPTKLTNAQADALLELYRAVKQHEQALRGVLPGATSMAPPVPKIVVTPLTAILDAAAKCKAAGVG